MNCLLLWIYHKVNVVAFVLNLGNFEFQSINSVYNFDWSLYQLNFLYCSTQCIVKFVKLVLMLFLEKRRKKKNISINEETTIRSEKKKKITHQLIMIFNSFTRCLHETLFVFVQTFCNLLSFDFTYLDFILTYFFLLSSKYFSFVIFTAYLV